VQRYTFYLQCSPPKCIHARSPFLKLPFIPRSAEYFPGLARAPQTRLLFTGEVVTAPHSPIADSPRPSSRLKLKIFLQDSPISLAEAGFAQDRRKGLRNHVEQATLSRSKLSQVSYMEDIVGCKFVTKPQAQQAIRVPGATLSGKELISNVKIA